VSSNSINYGPDQVHRAAVLVHIVDMASERSPKPSNLLWIDLGPPDGFAQHVTGKLAQLTRCLRKETFRPGDLIASRSELRRGSRIPEEFLDSRRSCRITINALRCIRPVRELREEVIQEPSCLGPLDHDEV
jgi:hypothetical protein